MFSTKLFVLFVLAIEFTNSLDSSNCKVNTNEYSKQTGNGGFFLFIRDTHGKLVERFQPSKEYTLTVKNYMVGTTFRNFRLQISPSQPIQNKDSLGNFTYPNYIEEDPNCPFNFNSKINKRFSTIKMKWRSPQFPEKCINFQVAIVMNPNLLYEDSRELKKKLCPSEMFTYIDNKPVKTSGLKSESRKCCACGTASYSVTFRGLWNKTTHPKDFPTEKGQLHWTDPIGVTHNNNYMIYNLGKPASQAVERVCTMGDTNMLKEQSMSFEEQENVKSLFTSRWMNGESELNEERSGYISVNNTHHLFSLISMMGPSPDWCTGVSGIDLCLSGCQWKDNLVIPLYPFDAGVKSGDTYIPKNSTRLVNPDPIREINKSWMKNNPFTPNTPVAELIIKRVQPLLDSECVLNPIKNVQEFHNMKISNTVKHGKLQNSIKDNPILFQMSKTLCKLSEWTPWTPCSVECGVGESTRQRELVRNDKNELCKDLQRHETKSCKGLRQECDYSGKCSLYDWSSWSPCNATCKRPGKIIRKRRFVRFNEKKDCLKTLGSSVKLIEEKECKLLESDNNCDPINICSSGKVVRCVKFNKSKIRFYYHVKTGKCESFKFYGCKPSLNNFKTRKECENTCSEVMRELPESRKLGLIRLQFLNSYTEGQTNVKKIETIPDKCFSQVDTDEDCKEGNQTSIWYYNHRISSCLSMTGFICHKNTNRFPSFKECLKTCIPNSPQNTEITSGIDCKVSNWGHWGPCSSKCGIGKQYKYRFILNDSINGGAPCPALFESRNCLEKTC